MGLTPILDMELRQKPPSASEKRLRRRLDFTSLKTKNNHHALAVLGPGRRKPSGIFLKLPFLLFLFISFLMPQLIFQKSYAVEENGIVAPAMLDSTPFVPRKREYSLEVGAMWEEQSLYWLAGGVGFHTGKCWLLEAENCQHYLDFVGGVGGGDGYEVGVALLGLRWQFIRYPSSWSPFVRLMPGYAYSETKNGPVFAAGFGISRYLHEHVDVKFEVRAGIFEEAFSQVTVGFNIKIDRWVDYFANKIKDLGQGTVKATGKILDATGKALSRPFKKKDEKKNEQKAKP